jgi:hypothetical protein
MASPRRSSQNSLSDWFDNPWKAVFSAFFTLATLFGIAYACASHFCSQDFKIEKMELKQEYNEKIQNAKDDCKDGKMEAYQKDINEIKETVKTLKKSK